MRELSNRLFADELTLNINTPLLRIEAKGLECALLAQALCLIDMSVATIVALARIPLGIFV